MKTLHTQLAIQPAILAKEIFQMERSGKYESALTAVKEIWEDISKSPQTKGFETKDAAEILLRCGALIGFLGHNKQIPNSQTRSKDLLTEARQKFLEIYETQKIAECENYLALAYWRSGELNEAKAWLDELESHRLSKSNYSVLYSQITKCLILIAENKYSEIIKLLQNLENDFLEFGDNCLKGDFYNALGIASNELSYRKEALEKLESARFYYQKAQHKIYLGTVENNLAQLYKLQENFVKAHQLIDCSTKTFKQIKDRTREGFSLDTKAQIYFSEHKFADALKTAEKALKILSKSENKAYLVETMQTKIKCLVFLDDFVLATLCLTDAVQISRTYIGEEAAKNIIKDFEMVLQAKNSPIFDRNPAENTDNAENLELVLPAELSKYENIQAIKIQNQKLKNFGLKQNSLAVVAPIKIVRGDLTAISEKATDEIYFGFYDADFGIVCLETNDSEPLLFDESEIEILGKIVGVCHTENQTSGKFHVEPIKL
ncbi:MAG TPA: hypothetical protein PKY59_19080 [Pyrinomonadaceae bacterium]|nr:hypothetical protein [Pyrinomonadaceae bacterium]